MNAFDHTNFEVKPARYNRWLGKVFTSATYHSMHHARYAGNYGLGTRLLDRLFKTEWKDYEPIYDRICCEQRPLSNLRERMQSEAGTRDDDGRRARMPIMSVAHGRPSR